MNVLVAEVKEAVQQYTRLARDVIHIALVVILLILAEKNTHSKARNVYFRRYALSSKDTTMAADVTSVQVMSWVEMLLTLHKLTDTSVTQV